ncbi:hypothetical protein [Ralstonia sp. UBA689]|uniref:hypothetical protein n=1 Tax=Ralstonia sp. UBA689 TaxID=1947373 RepID=UPI0025D455B0|nr:hypothetical protein [Ralstonia sp. UBA689]
MLTWAPTLAQDDAAHDGNNLASSCVAGATELMSQPFGPKCAHQDSTHAQHAQADSRMHSRIWQAISGCFHSV